MSHTHQHADHTPFDWAERAEELVSSGEVTSSLVEQALRWLVGRVPQARDVLDVGSGPGLAACLFGELLPQARILAVDGAEPLLALARDRADRLGLADRFSTRVVDLPADLTGLPPADLVWVSGVVHHLPDPVAALRALGDLVRPGGLLAVREGGLPTRFLPDGVEPGLLPRIDAASEELVADGEHPASVVAVGTGWPTLFREAGLEPAGSRSFLLDIPAPVAPEVRRYLHGRLDMLGGFVHDRLSGADRAALARLLDRDAPDGVLNRPDVFVLGASTVHTATA